MQTFKDTQSREWKVEINLEQIKLVRSLAKVDLYNLFGDEAKRLFADPVMLVDTLFVLCKQQASERNMTDIDFGRGFSGQVLEDAANALLEEVLNFFPQSRQKLMRAMTNKSMKLAEEMQTSAMDKIEKLSLTDLLSRGASPALSA